MSKFYKRKSNNLNNQTISSSFLTKEYKNTICNNSYLGQKGYSIPKKYLSEEDITFLKKELYVKPMTFGIGANTESAFYVYRESSSKMYLPRFYGIQRYGLPARHEISMGDSIDVPFVKELRDYQTNINTILQLSVEQKLIQKIEEENKKNKRLRVLSLKTFHR